MKKLFLILPLVFLLCFNFGCQKAEEPAVDIAAEEAAIREAFTESQKSGPAKDVELLLSFVADDALSFAGDKEAMREWYTNTFSKGRYWANEKITKLEISASGDMGYTLATWDYFNDEGKTGSGSNVLVWKKQADGTWKMVAF